MKTTLHALALLIALALRAPAHTGVELGPAGGRLIEFSKDETLHGELSESGGRFTLRLLDREHRPIPLTGQALTATLGDRSAPARIAVEKEGDRFTFPVVAPGQWIIFQYREAAGAKPITARFQYDTAPCPECKAPEWRCACPATPPAKAK